MGWSSFWSLPITSRDSGTPLGFLGVYTRSVRTPTVRRRTFLERARDLASLALDRVAHTEQLGFLALHDTLTTLPNRALGVERLEAALAALADNHKKLAVLFLDLDRFKVVNDGLGHETGDDLLVAVGRRLAGVVRRHDTVARFGGDEFVIICEQLDDDQQAIELAQRALEALARPVALRPRRVDGVGQHRDRDHRRPDPSSLRSPARRRRRDVPRPSAAAAGDSSSSTR